MCGASCTRCPRSCCGSIADCDYYEEIAAWGAAHLDFLRRYYSSLASRDGLKGALVSVATNATVAAENHGSRRRLPAGGRSCAAAGPSKTACIGSWT